MLSQQQCHLFSEQFTEVCQEVGAPCCCSLLTGFGPVEGAGLIMKQCSCSPFWLPEACSLVSIYSHGWI